MASTTEHVSVFDLTGDELAEYISWHREEFGYPPLAGGAPDDDDEDTDDDDGGDETEGSDDDGDGDENTDDADDDQDGDENSVEYWRGRSREHEARAKRLAKRLHKRQAQGGTDAPGDRKKPKPKPKGDGGDADKSDEAISQARDEAREEAREEHARELRATRLEASVTRLATDFEDPEDALLYLERAIRLGDVDEDDIFDEDGKPIPAEVKVALKDILKRKPSLKAGQKSGRFRGGSDARKGTGGRTAEDMSIEDHIKATDRHKK
ncbi:MAG: hypothetical protein PGN13_16285 [Patulibacter minatonensis]